ncbi:LacI family DNA-binding transcriptional regulator [Planctobacterium marinum]|uniref:Transcriptional regulator n=1 Tax=Planctobacterium marinum TaxID=1631968 RepID=A0AA48KV46_9ALTE|nr:transcriptional regulator [Planctobacterium marinum]
MATIKQVSELAGVSLATVSRVINNTDQVKPGTKAKVEDAMKTLGYRPNFIAQSLASNKSNTVGYVVPELHGSFFGDLLSGTERLLKQANKHLFIAAGHSNEVDEVKAIESLLSRRCDALILHLEAVSNDYLVQLAKDNVDFVVVNRFIAEISERCVTLDNVKGGYIATQALIDNGHKSIAYITGSLWKADAEDRFTGHKAALQEAGIALRPELVFEGDFQADSGYKGMSQLLNSGETITAVCCGNDEMAYGAAEAIREKGLRIPDDISLVGFDDIEFSRFLQPKLSTVKYPMRDIGETAAKMILQKIYNKDFSVKHHIFDPVMISRNSIKTL